MSLEQEKVHTRIKPRFNCISSLLETIWKMLLEFNSKLLAGPVLKTYTRSLLLFQALLSCFLTIINGKAVCNVLAVQAVLWIKMKACFVSWLHLYYSGNFSYMEEFYFLEGGFCFCLARIWVKFSLRVTAIEFFRIILEW